MPQCPTCKRHFLDDKQSQLRFELHIINHTLELIKQAMSKEAEISEL